MAGNKQEKASTVAVDYTPAQQKAQSQVRTAFRAYVTAEKRYSASEQTRTADCAVAVQSALESGWLVSGVGLTDDARQYVTTATKLAEDYGVSKALMTFWTRLAKALIAGVEVGDPMWGTLCGDKMARKTEVGQAIDSAHSVADIQKGIALAEKNAETRKARPNADAPKVDPKVSAKDGATAAYEALAVAVRSPAFQATEWSAMRTLLHRLIASEDRRRGLGPTRKSTKKQAIPAPAKSAEKVPA